MRFRQRLRDTERKTLSLVNQGFCMARCHYESIKVCRQGNKKFAQDDYWGRYLEHIIPLHKWEKEKQLRPFPQASAMEVRDTQRAGGIKMRRYPRIIPSLLRRGPELIATIKNDFIAASADKCVFRLRSIRDNIGTDNRMSEKCNVFGAFAATDLSPNERMLIENTFTGVLDSSPGRCDCCCASLQTG
jgi:hypothetical protein